MLDKVRVAEVLSPSCVMVNMVAADKRQVIEQLTDCLCAVNAIGDRQGFIADVLAREALGPTGFENQIAIPHGKSSAVRETKIAIGRLASPVDWETDDEVAVKLVILFAVKNADSGMGHIKVLASVSVALGDDEIVEQLMAAATKEELYQLIIETTGL